MDSQGARQSQMSKFHQLQLDLDGADSLVDVTLRLGISPADKNKDKTHLLACVNVNGFIPKTMNSLGVDNTQGNSGFASSIDVNSGRNQDTSKSPKLTHAESSRLYEFPAPPNISSYCLVNISTKRAKTGGSRKKKTTQLEPAKDQENRACSNYNCRVTESPMWRKGPFGPKTLCNRCGIRYRKQKMKEEKEKKNAEAAGRRVVRAVSKL